ncbi:MAG TPA: DUF1425 domain-containing protein [Verrucomicrobiae bacterium]|nr:DUF1425 domain-containing protein [Verrucomicrobiae bacterium]
MVIALATGCGSPALTSSQPIPETQPAPAAQTQSFQSQLARQQSSRPQPAQPQAPEPIRPSQPASAPPAVKDTRIIVDSSLNDTLRVVKVLSSTGADNLLKIQVDVYNMTAAPKSFDYQLEWFDKDGRLLPLASGGPLSWMLLAHETSSIVATAPAETAKDFGVAFLAKLVK